MCHRSVLLRRQLVQVLVDRCRWLGLVQDAVDAGQQDRREGQVGVRGRIRAAELDPLRLRVGSGDRDPHRGRAVAGAVNQIDRRLEARNQPVVGVHRRISEGEQRRCVLEDAADVPACDIGQSAVAGLVVEQRLTLVPERGVNMHARAVVAEDRLRHEGRRLPGCPGGVLDDVLVLLQVVAGPAASCRSDS